MHRDTRVRMYEAAGGGGQPLLQANYLLDRLPVHQPHVSDAEGGSESRRFAYAAARTLPPERTLTPSSCPYVWVED